MSEWQVRIPYRDRDALALSEIYDAAGEVLGDEDARVAQQLAYDALIRGTSTVGQLLDELEAVGPAGRRQLLDQARQNLGMRTTHGEEQWRNYEAANAGGSSEPPRDSQGRIEAICSEPGCRRFEPEPTMPQVIKHVHCRRWYCEKHRDGHEQEMKPWDGQPRVALSMSGLGITFPEETAREAERRRVQAESLRHQREAEEARRRGDGERIAKLERARDEQMRREQPRGLRPS